MTAYFVVGFSRSGTSLVAGLLHNNGIPMGGHFSGQREFQPAGYFEDLEIVNLNQSVLVAAGGNHLQEPSKDDLLAAAETQKFSDNIKRFFARRITRPEWGLKDPRLLLLWQYYEPHFEPADIKFIFTFRNVLSIARSLIEIDAFAPDMLLDTIDLATRRQQLTVKCAHSVTNYPQLFISFEDWWRQPDRQRAALSEFIGRDLDFSHFDDSLGGR